MAIIGHQRNTIEMAFRWRADDDPLFVVFGSSLPSTAKKQAKNVRIGPSQTKLSGSAHVIAYAQKPHLRAHAG